MSIGSPTAYLLWSILGCLFLAFMLSHLYLYDRFQCLRWNSGRQPGNFKRVMTYSYLLSVPLFIVFAVILTVLKFKEGYVYADGKIFPKDDIHWHESNRRWILPLYFILSAGWALELVTHLEELMFWVFLLNQGPGKTDWFASWEYRGWYLGTLISIIGMPLTALVSRKNIEATEAWLFLVGSGASTVTTLFFLYVLGRFPMFLAYVRTEGADPDVVVRLTTSYQLNIARVCFRFLFTLPLFTLALDGVQGNHIIDNDAFWSDFLLMIGGIGCFISSAITLLIFFPRSVTREAGYRPEAPAVNSKTPSILSRRPSFAPYIPSHNAYSPERHPASSRSYPTSPNIHNSAILHQSTDSISSPMHDTLGYETPQRDGEPYTVITPMEPVARIIRSGTGPWTTPQNSRNQSFHALEEHALASVTGLSPMDGHPVPRYRSRQTLGGAWDEDRNPGGGQAHPSTLHPYVTNYTSPIDLPREDDMRREQYANAA